MVYLFSIGGGFMAFNLFLTAVITAAVVGQSFQCAQEQRQKDYALIEQQRIEEEQRKAEEEAAKKLQFDYEAINALMPYQPSENSSLVGYNDAKSWWFSRNSTHEPPSAQRDIAIKNYDAYYLGDVSRKVIYLTFDEGYENGCTAKILDTLKENDVKAAFFVTKSYIQDQPELIKRMVDEGHIVGNHSVSHPDMTTLSDEKIKEEIEGCAQYFEEVTGEEMPKFFRPPAGAYSIRTLEKTNELGYKTIFWSFAYKDWLVDEQPGEQAAYSMAMNNSHNGSIMLLHAVSQSNTDALDRIIKDLKAEGYSFESLERLP
jgi:peptidoglycan-N-acetylmuramic acid deacetylase